MNLRLRLIVVFFLLSVVPLGALTLFSYANNARAVRDVARHEEARGAGLAQVGLGTAGHEGVFGGG